MMYRRLVAMVAQHASIGAVPLALADVIAAQRNSRAPSPDRTITFEKRMASDVTL